MEITIVRTFNGKPRQIRLTEEEIERVFRYQDMRYMMEDAKNHLSAYVDFDEENEDLKAQFKEEYGIDFDELINDEDVLEYLAERFSDEQDCNEPENITWEYVIDNYLAGLKQSKESADDASA